MCLICDRIEMIKRGTNPYFVKELETGYVVIGDNQHFYGYTLFLYKNHGNKTEIYHLEKKEQAKFLEEMTIVAEAVSKAFGAEKMNYELLGMGDAHIHWHLNPRRTGDIAVCYADPSKAKKEIGWVAEKGIEDMCKDAWNFIIKNR